MDIIEEKLNDNSTITANSKQLKILKSNFPQCFDKEGNFITHKMEEIVRGSGLELSRESYSLNWLGKSYARLLANENPRTLLKADIEHNNLEANKTSQNLLIKGDNLEVLKHLKNAYESAIKMIYIDPPYNTGSDGFVYNDDRKFSIDELSQLAGVSFEEAKRIMDFTTSNSNSHSAWLTFMYPRLYIARELMREDGVIFISIDDNEASQLKLLCDEVFGEENFVAQIMPIVNPRGRDYNQIAVTHEYILIYSFNDEIELNEISKEIEFKYFDTSGGFELRDLRNRNPKFHSGNRPNLFYPIYVNLNIKDEYGNYAVSLEKDLEYSIEIKPYNSVKKESVWRWGTKKLQENIIKDKPELSQVVAKKKKDGGFTISEKNRRVTTKVKSIWNETEMRTEEGTRLIRNLFNDTTPFDHPKPLALLNRIIEIGSNSNDIILDFFAGSGTTAHAVMDLNAQDGGNRKFILAQLPELTDTKSEAHKAGYKTIFDITKERIIRASKKIKEELDKDLTKDSNDYDLGFKIFETTPLLKNPLDTMDAFDEETPTLLDVSTLTDDDFEALLTTWKVHDGMPLTDELQEITLANYKAYYGDKKLYFVHGGFDTEDLKALILRLDDDKTFEPNKLILFGYSMKSKYQREISEALSSYTNKKSIELDMIVRY